MTFRIFEASVICFNVDFILHYFTVFNVIITEGYCVFSDVMRNLRSTSYTTSNNILRIRKFHINTIMKIILIVLAVTEVGNINTNVDCWVLLILQLHADIIVDCIDIFI